MTIWTSTGVALAAIGVAVLAGGSVLALRDESASMRPHAYSALPALFEVEVTGANFEWHVRYPGRDGVLWTADDTRGERDVHVPAAHAIRLHLRSRDFIYNLALPHFARKEPAVPELEFTLDFRTEEPGVFALRGDQMCGWTHEKLLGRLVVEAPGQPYVDGAAPALQ